MLSPLYLSDLQIRSLAIQPIEVIRCVEDALAHSTRSSVSGAKSTIKAENGSYFQALPSLMAESFVACVKWISVIADAGDSPSINATVVLTSTRDGSLLAILDGRWITAVRTAAMSALAARALARHESEKVGFIGCGVQAIAHLDALQAVFPGLTAVTAYARSQKSAALLSDRAARLGLSMSVVSDPRAAIEQQDIVVSSVPAVTSADLSLDANWLKAGAFASLVDLGRSWQKQSLECIKIVATDDRSQSVVLAGEGKLNHSGPYNHDLRELAASPPGELADGKASIFIFGGLGICDICVALLCYERARGRISEGERLTAL